METKKSVSIVIPNYNGRHLLKEYLPYTYAAMDCAGVAFEKDQHQLFKDHLNFVAYYHYLNKSIGTLKMLKRMLHNK